MDELIGGGDSGAHNCTVLIQLNNKSENFEDPLAYRNLQLCLCVCEKIMWSHFGWQQPRLNVKDSRHRSMQKSRKIFKIKSSLVPCFFIYYCIPSTFHKMIKELSSKLWDWGMWMFISTSTIGCHHLLLSSHSTSILCNQTCISKRIVIPRCGFK